MHRPFAIAVILLMLACGAPQTITAPTAARPTEVSVPTATSQPTVTPEPTKVPYKDVSHEQFGDAWPLTVEKGYILCMGGGKIVLQTERGLFAVNGTARGAHRWKDIFDITKPNPDNPALPMSVQPIIDRGLRVCK